MCILTSTLEEKATGMSRFAERETFFVTKMFVSCAGFVVACARADVSWHSQLCISEANSAQKCSINDKNLFC